MDQQQQHTQRCAAAPPPLMPFRRQRRRITQSILLWCAMLGIALGVVRGQEDGDRPFGPLSLRKTKPMEEPVKLDGYSKEVLDMLASLRSSHNCTDAPATAQADFAVCQLNDVVLYKGRILYVADDPSRVSIPDVSLDWLASGNLTKNQTDYERGLLKRYVDVVRPSDLRAAAQEGAPVITTVPEAAFMHFIFYFNYYHVFAEYAPTLHNVVCKFWGKCSYDPKERLRIFLTSNWDTHWDHLQFRSLVSPDFIKFVSLEPVVNTEHPILEGQLLVIRRSLAGWGHECRADHAHCLPWDKRAQPPRRMMELWRDRVASVLEFDPRRPVPVDPIKVVVIDRDYTDKNGRTVLNMRPVVKRMRRRYECHGVKVSLVALDGMNMQAQAALYNDATVLLWLHGAAMANLIFLPMNATALQIVHRPEPAELFYWVEELVRDLPNHLHLHHILNEDPDRVILKPGWVTKNPIFPHLSAKERLMVWEDKKCPHPEGHEYRHTCDEFFFKVGAAVELDPNLLFATLDGVIAGYLRQAADQQGRALAPEVANGDVACRHRPGVRPRDANPFFDPPALDLPGSRARQQQGGGQQRPRPRHERPKRKKEQPPPAHRRKHKRSRT